MELFKTILFFYSFVDLLLFFLTPRYSRRQVPWMIRWSPIGGFYCAIKYLFFD
jgi:hypothetical protein